MKFSILLLSVMLCVAGCRPNAATIVFVLPDGYNGLLLIAEDQVGGIDTPVVNGYCTLDVPKSGKLAVKSLDIFNRWHKEIGRYKNGTIISNDAVDSTTGYEIAALPFVPGKGCFYFIGTPKDFDAVSKKYDFEKLPLATKIDQAMLDTH